MGVYRVELAPSARATCKNTECKKNQEKIPKGDLRFCTQTEISGNVSWAYKHWGCTTPQQIKHLKDSIENNIDYLDGFDELPSDLKPKVLKAIEDGHVDDSDWRGDLSQNRPGSTSFRSPAPKKPKNKTKSEDNEGEIESGSPAPAPKKRGRGKKAEDADDEPPSKKAKATSKKGKIDNTDEAMVEKETETSHPKVGRGKGKGHKNEAVPKAAAKNKRSEVKIIAPVDGEGEEQVPDMENEAFEEPKAKKSRKKASKSNANDVGEIVDELKGTNSPDIEANAEIEKPQKARGRPRGRGA